MSWERGFDEAVEDAFALEMQRVYAAWWQRLNAAQHSLLKHCLSAAAFERDERRRLRQLVARGLVKESANQFTLPGQAWQEYVRRA